MLSLRSDGSITLDSDSTPLTDLLARSAVFRRAVQSTQLLLEGGQCAQPWPGLWLAPLPAKARRRSSDPIRAAMLIGADLLESEQLHAVCDSGCVDFQLIVSSARRMTLFTSEEAQRTAGLLSWLAQDLVELDQRGEAVESLSQQLGETYEELSLLYTLASNMSINKSPREFISEACDQVQIVSGLKWVALVITDDDRFGELADSITIAGELPGGEESLRSKHEALLRYAADLDGPRVVEDLSTLRIEGFTDLAKAIIIAPVVRDGRYLGALIGADKLSGEALSSVEAKLCSSLAASLTIFLENTMLYSDARAMFMGVLHALTASIDAKDAYTHGHSERVAVLSRELATAAGIDPDTVERVYLSGLLHDVGKIGVPEAVLCKPGKLTDAEFDQIKRHPVIGARILGDIRPMRDLIPGVLYHHERWDGRGYPDRLAGESIPLFGRLICLADSFDAMRSKRTYRMAMPHDVVLEEIRKCAGSQFDPRLAPLFVELDFTPFYDLLKTHQLLEATQGTTER